MVEVFLLNLQQYCFASHEQFSGVTNKLIMDKQCLECGNKLIGRIDKKFCNDYCRNAYNNKKNRVSKNIIRNTNNLLRKNYRILEKINPNQKTKTTKDNLLRKGFNFNYFTSIYTTKTGNVYYFVYDQGYLPLGDKYYAIVKRESND
jgi:predicted nucleic acid-binding Zn ribbon protein